MVIWILQVRSGQLEFEGRAGVSTELSDGVVEEEYLTYAETLPYIPSIKDLSLSKTSAQVIKKFPYFSS